MGWTGAPGRLPTMYAARVCAHNEPRGMVMTLRPFAACHSIAGPRCRHSPAPGWSQAKSKKPIPAIGFDAGPRTAKGRIRWRPRTARRRRPPRPALRPNRPSQARLPRSHPIVALVRNVWRRPARRPAPETAKTTPRWRRSMPRATGKPRMDQPRRPTPSAPGWHRRVAQGRRLGPAGGRLRSADRRRRGHRPRCWPMPRSSSASPS